MLCEHSWANRGHKYVRAREPLTGKILKVKKMYNVCVVCGRRAVVPVPRETEDDTRTYGGDIYDSKDKRWLGRKS